MPTIKTEILNVTPAMCAQWLEVNTHNRTLKQHHINDLTRTMIKGHWVLNGESFKIDTRGHVLDGQHRMWACIQANKNLKTLVTTGLPASAFDSIDIGIVRTASDILSINKEKNVNLLASTLKHVGKYYSNLMLTTTKATNKEVEDLLNQHPDIRQYVSKVANSPNTKWCPATVIATAWYIASRTRIKEADIFFESFMSGTNL